MSLRLRLLCSWITVKWFVRWSTVPHYAWLSVRTVWDVHASPIALGYHTAWASANLESNSNGMNVSSRYPSQELKAFHFHPWSLAMRYAVIGHKCSTYSPTDKYSEEVIPCSGLRASPENIMVWACIKKQEDVGLREKEGSDERCVSVCACTCVCVCVWREFFRQ